LILNDLTGKIPLQIANLADLSSCSVFLWDRIIL